MELTDYIKEMADLPDKAYYRPDEIASYFGVKKSLIYRQISEGGIPAIRIGASRVLRIAREDVEQIKRPVVEGG